VKAAQDHSDFAEGAKHSARRALSYPHAEERSATVISFFQNELAQIPFAKSSFAAMQNAGFSPN
jgi:hypothetical protein